MGLTQISTAGVKDDAVTSGKIPANAVGSSELADNAVDTAAIAADAVTGAKIADDAINSEHYTDGSIDTAHIADSQVTTAKIADSQVTTAKIADDAVTADKLANSINTSISAKLPLTGGTLTGNLTLSSTHPKLSFTDTNHNSDFQIMNNHGNLLIYDTTNATSPFNIDSSGNIQVSGTVDGVDIAALNTTVSNITTDVVSDTSPQLGGNLDTNSFEISFDDNHSANFGDSSDLKVLHTGSESRIDFSASAHNLKLQGPGGSNFVALEPRAGHTSVKAIANGAAELYHDNSKKFETVSYGTLTTGESRADNFQVLDYQSASSGLIKVGSGDDLKIYHNGTNSFMTNATGNLEIRSDTIFLQDNTNGHAYMTAYRDGAVGLRYDNSQKFETTAYGSRITGYQTQSSPVAFHAYSNGTISWSNSVIAFNSEVFDYGSNYNTSNYRFTAPVAGLYFFGIRLLFATGFGGLNMKLRKNGSNVMRIIGHTGASNGDAHTGFHIMSLSANDYVDIKGSDTHGGVAGGADESAFYGYLIG